MRLVPLLGLSYLALVYCATLLGLNHATGPIHLVPKWELWLSATFSFPAFTLVEYPAEKAMVVRLFILNAVLWGVSAVGIWHAASILHPRHRAI